MNAWEAFKKNNGVAPSRVIFYRDGVGEGQVQGICVPEIDQIKAAIASCGLSASCKVMYINCCKRVNTRIFDGAIGAWTPTAAMAAARVSHTATVLSNGRVLVAGGGGSSYIGGGAYTGDNRGDRLNHELRRGVGREDRRLHWNAGNADRQLIASETQRR